jgi:hypothetical protein
MSDKWDADPQANFKRRLGQSPADLGVTAQDTSCPDIWELDNGDVAVIGREHTESYQDRLPKGVSLAPGEKLVIIPGITLRSAKPDIPDA